MAAADRFSGLSDDMLVSVISFLSTKDAACTSVLSRRWRSLWLSTDALNLDSRSYRGLGASQLTDRFFSDAGAALRAAGRCPVRKLSLFVEGPSDMYCDEVMSATVITSASTWGCSDLLVALLAAEELRRIEELRLGFCSGERLLLYLYDLDLGVLPGNTLRVLDLACTRINLPRPPSATVLLPRLSVLRLHKCSSRMKDLEDFIRDLPCLGSLHIDSHDFLSSLDTRDGRFTLHCPSVTTVKLADLGFGTDKVIELDAPCLRNFKYDGGLLDFSMKSPTPELAQVELAITPRPCRYNETEKPWFGAFWRIIRKFQHAKILKLKVPNIYGIAVTKDAEHEHLVMLLSLERLELEGPCDQGRRNDTATAVANLLQCCPMIQDLQIRIVNQNRYGVVTKDVVPPHFDVSLDLFKRRYTKEIMAMIDGDTGRSLDVPELPGLSGFEFNCLRNHLKNVKLEFVFKEMNSFEVSFAKFLAENCMPVTVLQIVDGKRNFLSHINRMVERWRANAVEQRKQIEHDSAELSRQRGKGNIIPVGKAK
ncbi:F-box/FBD/LRR-repeat protein [Hordeum vulgare]|uniref:uncharacterized protein LOC123425219 n=1 Tax=Hordeum vulgare subsp. vulgare TaxID=112509 RepID=UPI001D1A3BE4|nr:uncharacterized protein LOC123425219 [Hordeum vulgare subsp. vulgare]KAE8775760.1 F-box/FBD/LRR-repeat protein [Hordeum vulgare]